MLSGHVTRFVSNSAKQFSTVNHTSILISKCCQTMSLPSKYAPEGLSRYDQHRPITSGRKRPQKPINYTVRVIEARIKDAVENRTYNNSDYGDGDIEMIPMDDYKEVEVISEFVEFCRDAKLISGNRTLETDAMEDIVENTSGFELAEGNISYLVIDTNFLLSHLNILDEIKNIADKYELKLVVPITVIQELDGLKNSNRTSLVSSSTSGELEDRISGKSIGHLARWATDWIYSCLSKNSGVVKGQKLRERLNKDAVKDDAILDCALYLKECHANSLIVLFSNDKNLCTKALANGVLTVSYKKHMTSELIANVVHTENVSRFGKIEKRIVEVAPAIQSMSYSNSNLQSNPQYLPSQSLSQSDSQSHLLSHSRKNSHVLVEQNVRQFSSFHQIAEKVYTEIQMIALSAIHQCMESVFNEDLDLLQDYEKEKVITLTDCSNVMIRFWFTVFQPYFKKLPNKFTPFDESGRNKTPLYVDLPRDSYELLQFVHFWTKTLSTIYAAEMDDSKNEALDILVQRWESMASLY